MFDNFYSVHKQSPARTVTDIVDCNYNDRSGQAKRETSMHVGVGILRYTPQQQSPMEALPQIQTTLDSLLPSRAEV